MPVPVLWTRRLFFFDSERLANYKWVKKDGDRVKIHDAIAECVSETNFVIEVTAIADGILKILVPEVSPDLPENTPVGLILEDHEVDARPTSAQTAHQFQDIDAAEPVLKAIMLRRGRELLEKQDDCLGLLYDYLPESRRAREVLLQLLRQRAPQRLLEMPVISETGIGRFAAKIAQEGDVPMSEAASHSGLMVWASALALAVTADASPVEPT